MTKQEWNAWIKETQASKRRWQVDLIHNGHSGQDLLVYKGGSEGVYFNIEPNGLLIAGDYKFAIPHIGDAAFGVTYKKQFKSYDVALKSITECLGLGMLLDITTKIPQQTRKVK